MTDSVDNVGRGHTKSRQVEFGPTQAASCHKYFQIWNYPSDINLHFSAVGL